jgi:hypothetical protein
MPQHEKGEEDEDETGNTNGRRWGGDGRWNDSTDKPAGVGIEL